ncbi:hypothetical protein GCM10009747_15480 [Agromyces humatus]|uniref:Glyoxalase/fosfomycin resistance/dioxygenase domain-containing protein n=1 Tax=Agromyces humatus TaxID=279573 RepID=A0ABN2KJY0_9MICO
MGVSEGRPFADMVARRMPRKGAKVPCDKRRDHYVGYLADPDGHVLAFAHESGS